MRVIKTILLVWLAVGCAAQPFIDEIKNFRKQDSVALPPKDVILFIGSSSFTNWKDVQDYFPEHKILNRGFGGSSLTDLIYYADDIIFRYQPKQIVIYCGENDFAANDSLYPAQVADRFFKLFRIIREKFKTGKITYISMKPSPSRWDIKERMISANAVIKDFLNNKTNTTFINVWNSMLSSDGNPIEDIFIRDKLHMNEKGYRIWQKLIEPHLLK